MGEELGEFVGKRLRVLGPDRDDGLLGFALAHPRFLDGEVFAALGCPDIEPVRAAARVKFIREDGVSQNNRLLSSFPFWTFKSR